MWGLKKTHLKLSAGQQNAELNGPPSTSKLKLWVYLRFCCIHLRFLSRSPSFQLQVLLHLYAMPKISGSWEHPGYPHLIPTTNFWLVRPEDKETPQSPSRNLKSSGAFLTPITLQALCTSLPNTPVIHSASLLLLELQSLLKRDLHAAPRT